MAEELKVNITGDASKLKRVLDDGATRVSRFSDKVGKVGKIATMAGVAITAAFTAIVVKTAAVGDQFDKMSLRTGISVENLSALAYAADISGTDIGTLEKGLKALTKVMDDATMGIGEGLEAFELLDISVVTIKGDLNLTNEVIKQTAIEIDEMGKPTALTTTALDKLGISVVDIEGDLKPTITILKEAAEKITDIEDPAEAAALAFDIFGDSAVDTEEKLRPTIDVLKEAATKISAIEDPTKQAALAMDLFGARAGPALLPLLKQGEDGIEALMEKAQELGISLTTEAATAAAEFTDRLTDLKGSLAGTGRIIGDTLIPAITPLIEKATEIVGKIAAWARENSELTEKIFTWGAALGVALMVLGPILVILPGLITGITMLSGAFLPFAIGGALVLGLKKLSEYMEDIQDKAFEVASGFKEWDLYRLESEIFDMQITIGNLGQELKEADEGFTIFGLTLKNNDISIGRLRYTIMRYERDLKRLEERREELTKVEQEGIDVTEAKIEIEEQSEILMKKIIDKTEEERRALEKKTRAAEKANAETEIGNRVLELSLEPLDFAIQKVDSLRDSYIEHGIEVKTVSEWYELEILTLKELYKQQKENIDTTGDAAKALEELEDRISQLTDEMEYHIGKLDEERQEYIELGFEIDTINEWYDLEIAKLKELTGEVETHTTAFMKLFTDLKTDFKSDFIDPVIGYLVDELTPAFENLFFGNEDFVTSWEDFWSGLWNILKTYISNMVVKLLIAIPLMLIWGAITGGFSWATFWQVWNFLGFEEGGGVGYDKGGQVKGYQAGGVADTIPAMLTVGEYVIAKPMTDFIRRFKAFPSSLIDAISQGIPTPTPAFAGGGLVGGGSVTAGSGQATIYVDIHDNRISDDVDIKKLATVVGDEILRKINLNRRH